MCLALHTYVSSLPRDFISHKDSQLHKSLCDIRPDCHHYFDARRKSLMSPLAGMKHKYARLAK